MKSPILRVLQLAFVLSIPSYAFAAPADSAHSGLPNFGTVAPGVYRGAAPTDDGLSQLKAMGVQTDVDLRISPERVKTEKAEAEKRGMRFVNLPMGSDPPTEKQKKTFLAIAAQAGQHPVYVHCQYGADRTGVMVGIYRRVVDRWDYDKTYAEMRKYGFKPYYTKLAEVVKNSAPN